MSTDFLPICCVLSILLCSFYGIRCDTKDDDDDDIFSFSSNKPIPIKSSQSSGAKKTSSGASASTNPYNGIQELTNQFKDGNFNNMKKISDSNTNILMNVLGLGSNWMSTNLRLASQWNDLNRDLAEKAIYSIHKINDNNLRFIKQTVETTNNNIKTTLEPVFKGISNVRDTFNSGGKDESTNSLALVSKSGRPVETLAEIKNELPSGLVNAASSWIG